MKQSGRKAEDQGVQARTGDASELVHHTESFTRPVFARGHRLSHFKGGDLMTQKTWVIIVFAAAQAALEVVTTLLTKKRGR